jgi:hypothetical protein
LPLEKKVAEKKIEKRSTGAICAQKKIELKLEENQTKLEQKKI